MNGLIVVTDNNDISAVNNNLLYLVKKKKDNLEKKYKINIIFTDKIKNLLNNTNLPLSNFNNFYGVLSNALEIISSVNFIASSFVLNDFGFILPVSEP